MNYAIRRMLQSEIDAITEVFTAMNKTREQYVRYFEENGSGERVTLVASVYLTKAT
jgi:hypothetical protein